MAHYSEEPGDSNINFPCGICNNHQSVKCSICNYRIHMKCNKMDVATFEVHNNSDDIFCIKCQDEIIPFQKLSDDQFYMTSEKCINNQGYHRSWKVLESPGF